MEKSKKYAKHELGFLDHWALEYKIETRKDGESIDDFRQRIIDASKKRAN